MRLVDLKTNWFLLFNNLYKINHLWVNLIFKSQPNVNFDMSSSHQNVLGRDNLHFQKKVNINVKNHKSTVMMIIISFVYMRHDYTLSVLVTIK